MRVWVSVYAALFFLPFHKLWYHHLPCYSLIVFVTFLIISSFYSSHLLSFFLLSCLLSSHPFISSLLLSYTTLSSPILSIPSLSPFLTSLTPSSLSHLVGLFDTAMSSLALGSCIGACSEKLQDSIQSYIKENPDGAVSSVMTERLVM